MNLRTLRHFLIENGFVFVLIVLILGFSLLTSHFASFANAMAMLHSMAPIVVISGGLAVVVLAGKLDISVGSIAFLSATIATLLMTQLNMSPIAAFGILLCCGLVLGALNGFIVVVLGINPLIATLGTMLALRGIGLYLTNAVLIPLPTNVAKYGNAALGPIFIDVLVAAILAILLDTLHRRTIIGRQLNAIGNGEEIAARIGLKVRSLVFFAFILSGLMASIGGAMLLLQDGAISGFLGEGAEFTAVSIVVVGGISLFGGRGQIIPGVLLGALTFQVIENGLNQMSANPYAYHLVTGVIIFVAMYVDAIKSGRVRLRKRAMSKRAEETIQTRKHTG